jgi:aryl-phospho-beta-D-glucosidase BglC (GH1 family)
VILDLHAAAGSQNCDWHADSAGRALLWDKKDYQQRTFALWERIVDRFKDEKALVGYDVLNEPVLGPRSITILKKFYQKLIKRIRSIDKKSWIFLEGNTWAQEIDFLKDLIDDNISVSIHTYLPLNYTFNFTPFYKFPGKIEGIAWDRKRIFKYLEPYYKFSLKNKVPIFVGEFGINWRGGFWGELKWLEAILSAYTEFGFGYTYWTYKSIARSMFPDGLYQSITNCKYINREGPILGWETWLEFWSKEKKDIINFWQTKNFTPNKELIAVLRKFFKKKEKR